MKFGGVLVVSLGLAFAPAAHAQLSCAQANDLTEAAVEEFAAFSGEEIEDYVYEGTLVPEGAAGCQVTADLSADYSCMWAYSSFEAADAAYGKQSSVLADCYGEWERAPFTDDSGSAGEKTLEGVSYYSVDDDGGEFTWITFVEDHAEGDTHDWHVWVGLDYF